MTRYPYAKTGDKNSDYDHRHNISIGVVCSPELPSDIPLDGYKIPLWNIKEGSNMKLRKTRSALLYTYRNKDYTTSTFKRVILIRPEYRFVGSGTAHSLYFIVKAVLRNLFPSFNLKKIGRNQNIIIYFVGDKVTLNIPKIGMFHPEIAIVDDHSKADKIYHRLLILLTWLRNQSTHQLKKFNSPIPAKFFSEFVADACIPSSTLQSKFRELVQKLKTTQKLELEDIRSNMPTTISAVPSTTLYLDLQLLYCLKYISRKGQNIDSSTSYLKSFMEN